MTFLCVSGEEYMKHGSKSHTSVIAEQIMKFSKEAHFLLQANVCSIIIYITRYEQMNAGSFMTTHRNGYWREAALFPV